MKYLNGLQKLIRSRSMYSLTRVTETVLTCSCGYGRVLEPSFLVDPEFCDMNDQQSSYYQSGRFSQVLHFVQTQSKLCAMKEKQTPNGLRLLLTFENVKSIRKALELMEMI